MHILLTPESCASVAYALLRHAATYGASLDGNFKAIWDFPHIREQGSYYLKWQSQKGSPICRNIHIFVVKSMSDFKAPFSSYPQLSIKGGPGS